MTDLGSLATVEELAARAAVELPLPAEDAALAERCLKHASALVRHYGLPWADVESAPAIANTLTVEAANRGFQNPAGLDMERGDAVTFNRHETHAQGVYLTRSEQRLLEEFKPSTSLTSVSTANTDQLVARSGRNGQLLPPWLRGYAMDWQGQKPCQGWW